MRLSVFVFLACLTVWGYELCNAESHLGPSNHLLVCGKYVLYTSKTVTGDQSVEVEGNPDKDQYYLTLMHDDQHCSDLEVGREHYDKTQVGDPWEFRVQLAGGTLFRPRK